MYKTLLAGLFLLAGTLLPAQTPTMHSVFFALDQFELSPEARQTLDYLIAGARDAADYDIDIDAFTDNSGSEQYNQRLAADRAAAVQQYFISNGILPGKTAVKSWGERKLIFDNNTEENRQKNRRVDISLHIWRFNDLQTMLERLSSATEQTYRIEPAVQQTVNGRNGSIVVVQPNSFIFEDGTAPEGPIDLVVCEALTPADWLLNNLTTMSGDRILQTGGMLYISAQAGGRTLRMAGDGRITIAVPARKVDPEMELFYGKHNPDSSLNWQAARQQFRRQLESPEVYLKVDAALAQQLQKLPVPKLQEPKLPKYGQMPKEPGAPFRPYQPRAPQRPQWENVQKQFAVGGTLKGKKLRRATLHYQKALASYRRDSLNFEVIYANYLIKSARFYAAQQKYEQERAAWENEVCRRIKGLMDYERSRYMYLYAAGLQNTLKNVGKKRPYYYRNLEKSIGRDAAGKAKRMAISQLMAYPMRPMTDAVYYKTFGHTFVDDHPRFKAFFNRAGHDIPRDTLERAMNGMMKTCGLQAVSDSLYAELKAKEIASAKTAGQRQQLLNAYVTDIDQLGWINVDKFSKMEGERMMVSIPESEDASMYAVCRDINSIVPVYRNLQSGDFSIASLPKGMKITIVSIKMKEGRPQMAMQDMMVGQPTQPLNYQNHTLRTIKEELLKLNS